MTSVIPIGIYRELCKSKPNADSIVNHLASGPYPEKAALLSYMRSAEIQLSAMDVGTDVIDGVSKVFGTDRKTDGTYTWTSHIEYYIDKYNLRPPEDFIAHVMAQMDKT